MISYLVCHYFIRLSNKFNVPIYNMNLCDTGYGTMIRTSCAYMKNGYGF